MESNEAAWFNTSIVKAFCSKRLALGFWNTNEAFCVENMHLGNGRLRATNHLIRSKPASAGSGGSAEITVDGEINCFSKELVRGL